jgi:hypothetical protein
MLSWSPLQTLSPNAMLYTRQLIPPLTLHVPDGRTVRAWDFKQKKNLVIAFLDVGCAPCEDFVHKLAERGGDLRAKEAVALAVFIEVPPQGLTEALPPEIFAGSDVSGRAARAFLGEDALSPTGLGRRGIFVTDRYGELAGHWLATGHEFPPLGEILACLNQLEIACEECSSPQWPSEG